MQAVGSVWNKNAWHWEEKNCTKWGTDNVKELFEKIQYKVGGFNVTLDKEVKVTGESNVNIRKQKLLYLYDFTIHADWKATLIEKPSEIASGNFEILERNQDDGDDMQMTLSMYSKPMAAFDKVYKEFSIAMRSHCLEVFNTFMAMYKQYVNQDMLKDRQDKQEKETQKLQEVLKDVSLTKEESKVVQKMPEQKKDAKGSEWNVNSYHWEEKPLTTWSLGRIKEMLSELKFGINGIVILLKTITPTGEANANIRKGKKLLTYDITISIEWESEHATKSDECNGSIQISDLSTDVDIGKIKIVNSLKQKGKDAEQIEVYISNEITKKIREVVSKFISEMKDK